MMLMLIIAWSQTLYRSQFLLPGLRDVTSRRAPAYTVGIDPLLYTKETVHVAITERLPSGALLGKIEKIEED